MCRRGRFTREPVQIELQPAQGGLKVQCFDGGGVEFIVDEPEEAGFGEAVCLPRKLLAENWALARCDS